MRRRFGFTLLEILIVILIVSALSSLLVIRIEGVFSGGDLREGTRVVVNMINSLRGQAAYSRESRVLGLHMDKNILYPIDLQSEQRETAGNKDDEGGLFSDSRSLPPGVILLDVVVHPKGKFQDGEARIIFFPNGCVEHALIHLGNEKDQVYTLEVNPVTGQVRVYDRYVDQQTKG